LRTIICLLSPALRDRRGVGTPHTVTISGVGDNDRGFDEWTIIDSPLIDMIKYS